MPLPITDCHFSLQLEDFRIHALCTGLVKFKRSHFEPGYPGKLSLLDPKWTAWLPIYSWLIEHDSGPLIFDTGVHPDMQALDYYKDGTMNGWMNARIIRFDLKGYPTLPDFLGHFGYSTQDVRHVIISHLHLDHVGRLDLFPSKPIILSKNENNHLIGVMDRSIPESIIWQYPSWQASTKELPLAHTCLAAYENVFLLDSPGHSAGHMALLIKSKDFDVLLAGDITYNQKQLLDERTAGICFDKEAAADTIRSIKLLAIRKPLLYLPSHDPQVPQRMASKAFISFES